MREGDIVRISYRFESMYTSGDFVVERKDGVLGVNVLTARKGFYGIKEDEFEFIPLNDKEYLDGRA